MDYSDQPQDVRTGDELPVAAIETYIKDTVKGLDGPVSIKQYAGGASNLTYLLTVGNKDMILRRPPSGTKAKSAHDMGREFKVLSALSKNWPYAPKPLAYTDDPSVIGMPFYVMERIKGIILRKEIPDGLFTDASEVRTLFENFVKVIYELHSLDYENIGLGHLGAPQGYVERQVKGWSNRYRAARTPDVPDFEDVMTLLWEKMPPESDKPAVIHNDFKFDNVVLDLENPLKIIGVLDWEMTTIGDPLMDLGGTLGYWVEKDDPAEMRLMRTMPTHVDGAMTRKEFVNYYGQLSGLPMKYFDFYYCFGMFRLAVIVQQIYHRFYHGQTTNARVKKYVAGIPILEKAVKRIFESSNL